MTEEIAVRKCKVCGAALPPQNKLYCSHRCRAEAIKNRRKCVVCGSEFSCSPANVVLCCSPACSKIHRQIITGEREGNAEHLKSVREEFARTHSAELHQNAKHYGIVTPSGEVIDVTNLRYWVYHSGLFSNPVTAYRELFRVLRTLDGKEANPKKQLTHYCGYTFAYHDDGNQLHNKAAVRQTEFCKICGSPLPPRKHSYCSEDCARKGHAEIEYARYHKKGAETDA